MSGRGLLTKADWVLLVAMVAAGAGLFLTAGGGEATVVRVTGALGYADTLDLGGDATVEVPGPLGTTVVEIANGAARVVSSPCRQQICVSMGAASRPGDVIVCVPNGVVVEVLGGTGRGVDAVTR